MNLLFSFRQVHGKTSVGLATISRICFKHFPNLEKSCGCHPAKLSAADINYTKLNMQRNKIKLLFKQLKYFKMLMGNQPQRTYERSTIFPLAHSIQHHVCHAHALCNQTTYERCTVFPLAQSIQHPQMI
jgi:hypothetical protein